MTDRVARREPSMAPSPSPFHAGELRVQEQLGVAAELDPWARRVVRDHMPAQHRRFYQQLPFLVVAARDERDRPWATLLTGRPGFAHADSASSLTVDAVPHSGDPLHGALRAGADIGLLGIDLAARRRNRLNGTLAQRGPPLRIAARQTFGNCSQYIRPRTWRWAANHPADPGVAHSAVLSTALRARIAAADTLFVASGYRGRGSHPGFGMDASHRGGPAGFVEVIGDRALVIPDYAGNRYFNTIGNLALDPRVGLLWVDFDRGSLLQITGQARIDWHPADGLRHPGARRLIRVEVEAVVEARGVLPLRWSDPGDAVRNLQVAKKIPETREVTSLLLASRDGGALPVHRAGQHLPIEVQVPGYRLPLSRSYSLSNAPGAAYYRLSVKREPHGEASGYLHHHIAVGDQIDAAAPAGEFVLEPGRRPVVLASAGIGVTPMMSMLHQLAGEPVARPVWFIHGARDGAHHAFAAEIRALGAKRRNFRLHVAYSRPRPSDLVGRHFDTRGRVSADLIDSLLPDLDADIYLCGPAGFLTDLASALEGRGVPAAQIRSETFGRLA